MRTAISLLLLPLLLLYDRSAAGSFDHGSVGAESEPRDGVTDDIRLREEISNQVPPFERSEINWTSSSIRTDYPCPEAADIAPCDCTVIDNTDIVLDCSLVASEEQLAAVFQQEFPVKELHKFSMKTNNAITVLGNILNGVSFQSIELSPGLFALEEISENFISDSIATLTSLTIHNSQLTTDLFPFAILSQMEILRWIDISSSAITSILPITAPKTFHVSLSYGLTDTIEAGTFSINEMDTNLYLSYNQIVTVQPGSFFFSDDNSAASSQPLSIHLENNQIQSLQAETFPLRNAEVNLYLKENQITSIEPGTFFLPEATGAAGSGALTIYLIYNQIQSLQAGTFPIPNANVELYLYSNEIASIEAGTFVLSETTGAATSDSLTIYLFDNQLESLQAGTFPLRDTTVQIQLQGNQIASIEPGTFVLPEATDNLGLVLTLDNNQLTTVDEAVFGDLMPFIASLNLEDNPLSCGCDIAWLVLNSEFINKIDDYATCANGTNLHDLDPQFYTDSC